MESGIKRMDTFLKSIDWILVKLKIIGAVCLVVMTLLTCADVVGRMLRHPVFGSVELVTFMATLSMAMALPYTHQVKGHIGVEILVRMFSEFTQDIIDLCTSVVSLILFGIVTWQMARYALTIQKSGEVSISLKFPEYLIIYVFAFCMLIFTLIIVRDILDISRKLRNR
jgi:TRAP-type C4-dicarboxylate transport system permease small subunit